METGLHDKVVLVAGSSKGLGLAIARQAGLDGAKVFLGSRIESHLDRAVAQLCGDGVAEVAHAPLDCSDAGSIAAWVDAARERWQRIDGLVVNAGGPPAGRFDDFDDVAWQDAFELSLMSAVRLIRAVLPTMRAQNSGSILTLTSSTVKEPVDVLLLSNVMRSGVTSLAKSLSGELGASGIRINNLLPGSIATDRIAALDVQQADREGATFEQVRSRRERGIPLSRYGEPDELGRVGAFLLSEAASYITGATLAVDGGAMRTVW